MEKNQSIRFQLDRYFRIDEFFTFDSRRSMKGRIYDRNERLMSGLVERRFIDD